MIITLIMHFRNLKLLQSQVLQQAKSGPGVASTAV